MPKHWISLLLLIALTVLFLVFWESPPALLTGEKAKPKAEFPAAYMIDSHSQHFDEDGRSFGLRDQSGESGALPSHPWPPAR